MNNIAIIEDEPNTRQVLTEYFSKEEGFNLLISAESFEAFWEEYEHMHSRQELDLILCDIGLPGKSGIEVVVTMKHKFPNIQLMMFTVFEDADKIFQALCAGATGYILKTTPLHRIKEGMLEMLDGGASISPKMSLKIANFFNSGNTIPTRSRRTDIKDTLTARELEILSKIQKGDSNKKIAEELFISVDTVKYHLKNIYSKLHITCRKDLFLKYSNFQFSK